MLPFPIIGSSWIRQIFHHVAVTSKRLTHPNIVPLLGATLEPLELISDWMPGGDLPEYIESHHDADRVSLVRVFIPPSGAY